MHARQEKVNFSLQSRERHLQLEGEKEALIFNLPRVPSFHTSRSTEDTLDPPTLQESVSTPTTPSTPTARCYDHATFHKENRCQVSPLSHWTEREIRLIPEALLFCPCFEFVLRPSKCCRLTTVLLLKEEPTCAGSRNEATKEREDKEKGNCYRG